MAEAESLMKRNHWCVSLCSLFLLGCLTPKPIDTLHVSVLLQRPSSVADTNLRVLGTITLDRTDHSYLFDSRSAAEQLDYKRAIDVLLPEQQKNVLRSHQESLRGVAAVVTGRFHRYREGTIRTGYARSRIGVLIANKVQIDTTDTK